MVCSGKLVDLGEGPAQLLLEANAPSALIAMLNEGRHSAPVSHCPCSSFGHMPVMHRVSAVVLRLLRLLSHIFTMATGLAYTSMCFALLQAAIGGSSKGVQRGVQRCSVRAILSTLSSDAFCKELLAAGVLPKVQVWSMARLSLGVCHSYMHGEESVLTLVLDET